jgi:hypothetical protein
MDAVVRGSEERSKNIMFMDETANLEDAMRILGRLEHRYFNVY